MTWEWVIFLLGVWWGLVILLIGSIFASTTRRKWT